MAPAASRLSFVSGSVVTAAVRPTPDDPFNVDENGKQSNLHGRSQQLALGRQRITYHQDVNVSAKMGSVIKILLHSR